MKFWPSLNFILVLSHYTGNDKYRARADNAVRAIIAQASPSGVSVWLEIVLNTALCSRNPSPAFPRKALIPPQASLLDVIS